MLLFYLVSCALLFNEAKKYTAEQKSANWLASSRIGRLTGVVLVQSVESIR
jgi:hypothetical protein